MVYRIRGSHSGGGETPSERPQVIEQFSSAKITLSIREFQKTIKKTGELIRPRILHLNAVRHILPRIPAPVIRALDPEHMPVVHRRNKDLLCIPPVRQVHRVLHTTPDIAKRAVPEIPHDAVREVARVVGCHIIQVGIPVSFHHPCIWFPGNRR